MTLRSVNQQALVVGDPDFSGWTKADRKNLEPLKGAKKEAKTVDTELEDSHAVELLRSKEATKEAVVEHMLKSDVVHLATRRARRPLLRRRQRGGGDASMAEVQDLKLRARLVVLSACDTFKGELRTDGVVGITRAFVAAGALTLVSSLWRGRRRDAQLMRRFYQAWMGGGNAVVAMQAAMVGMIKEGKWSVLQWSAFVVYGLAGAGDGSVPTSAAAGATRGGSAIGSQYRSGGFDTDDMTDDGDDMDKSCTLSLRQVGGTRGDEVHAAGVGDDRGAGGEL